MASIRLTHQMRHEIRITMLERSEIAKQIEECLEQRGVLADEAYKTAAPPAFLRTAGKNPSWFPTSSGIDVRFGGKAERLYFTGDKKRPLPHDVHYGYLSLPADHPLSKRRKVIVDKLNLDLYPKRRELKRQIDAILHSATTVEKLIQAWPDAEQVIRSAVKAPAPTTAVMVVPKELNKALGLPPK